MTDFLNGLNEPQRKAAENINGASLVLAGAGSGKTRVLTFRIANLLFQKVPSYNILSLTFTNKAASEMKARISNLVGEEACKSIWMGTFHSVFSRILRFESEKLGFTPNFTIYDTSDTKSLIKKLVSEMNLDPETYKPGEVLSKISKAKNNLVTAQTYYNTPHLIENDRKQGKYEIANLYKAYANRCKKADAMDFDDLLLFTNILFRDYPELLEKYQEKFKYILVDEYQDTNFAQYLIVKKLSAKHNNICVVGDDAQSIYSFRGAKIENILNFQKDYPKYQLYKLEQNYRSTQTIVNAANSVIRKNKDQLEKNTFSENAVGAPLKVLKAITDTEEGYLVANNIFRKSKDESLPYSDFAILYRTNAQSRILEEALNKLEIPCKIHGGLSFFQRKEIKDFLAYIRLAINNKDEEALLRIINYPARGIGKASTDKLEIIATKTEMPIWEILANAEKLEDLYTVATIKKMQKFHAMIQGFSNDLQNVDAYTLAHRIAEESGMIDDLKDGKSAENISKYENLQEILNGVKEFSENDENTGANKLTDYLEKIALLTDIDEERTDENRDMVTLMTVHSSKGLEFPHIYIVGLEETLFPSSMSAITDQDTEEERRLFYVALTRAEVTATLTYATSRRKWGKLNTCTPSRFIAEIDPQYVHLPDSISPQAQQSRLEAFGEKLNNKFSGFQRSMPPKARPTETPLKKATNFVADPPEKLLVHMTVEHEKFGIGTIVKMEGTPPNAKALVEFKDSGSKNLLLKFAKLRIVNEN